MKRDGSVHGNQLSWNIARCICHGYCFVYFSWVVLAIFSQDQLRPPGPAVSYASALLTFSFVGSIYCGPNWPGYWVTEDSGTAGEMDAVPEDIRVTPALLPILATSYAVWSQIVLWCTFAYCTSPHSLIKGIVHPKMNISKTFSHDLVFHWNRFKEM